MFPHVLDSLSLLTHLGCVDAEERAELLEGDIVVQLGRGEHVVLDDRALEHLRRAGSQTGRPSRLGTRGFFFKQHRLPSKNFHLDKAREGASPLRRCLVSATAAPLRSPPHPLQTCKSNLSTISLHRRSHAERRLGSHYSVRTLRSLSIPSAPEA